MDRFQLDVSDLKFIGADTANVSTLVSITKNNDEPLKLHVETDTDWAAISPSIAGVIVTLLVAWLTLRLQRKQTIANLSVLRQQWMVELRAVSSEYFSLIYKVALRTEAKPGFRSTEEYIQLYEAMSVTGSKFELLLSRDDNETQQIIALDSEIFDLLNKLEEGEDCRPALDKLNELKELIKKELEAAWDDIKKDVGLVVKAKADLTSKVK